jgi:hypothetical protein
VQARGLANRERQRRRRARPSVLLNWRRPADACSKGGGRAQRSRAAGGTEVELVGVVVDDGVVDGAGAARGRGACRWRANAAYSVVILV